MEPNKNIDWTAVGSAVLTLAVALGALFGFDLSPDTQKWIVAVVSVLGSAVTLFLNRVWNPPVNRVKFNAALMHAREAGVKAARSGAAAFLVMLLAGGLLARCSTIGSYIDSTGQQIGQGLVLAKDVQAGYISLCFLPTKPQYCPAVADAQKISGDFTTIAVRIVGVYKAHGDTTLLQAQFAQAVSDITNMLTAAKAKAHPGAALSPVEWVSLFQASIALANELYADWKAISGIPADAQLDGWLKTIVDQNARIQQGK